MNDEESERAAFGQQVAARGAAALFRLRRALFERLKLHATLNGLVLVGVPGIWQQAVLGALILLAVTTDVVRRRLVGDGV